MKKLYSQSSQAVIKYPRNDEEPVVGLDPDFLILTVIETEPPEINEGQYLSADYTVNLDNLEYVREWVIHEAE